MERIRLKISKSAALMTPIDLKPEFDEVGFRVLLAPLLQGEREQRLPRNVPMIPFALEKATVTASFGVTEHVPADTVDIFVQRADALLYEAKAGGRNAVRDILKCSSPQK